MGKVQKPSNPNMTWISTINQRCCKEWKFPKHWQDIPSRKADSLENCTAITHCKSFKLFLNILIYSWMSY